jgi:Flp pilus assembly protein TadB
MAMRQQIRRELRVAFSKHAQPLWFRVVKWIAFCVVIVIFWRKPGFWWWIIAVLIAALSLHFVYRFKTRCWTRAWGGWNDLEAGRMDR